MDTSVYTKIRHRISIVDLVSEYVKLRKKGNHWGALCPFHQEKSPSFVVQENKGSYHCFGCGAHGDVIDFVKNIEGITHAQALEKLAERAHISLPKDKPEKHKDFELKHCLLKVCDFFVQALQNHPAALHYLRKRGISLSCQEHFKLGWCDVSVMSAIKAHLSSDVLIKSGLISEKNGRNFFEGRIMFPILNSKSEVLGFGGRSLQDQKMPKYLNSPETPLFVKHQTLYGIGTLKHNSSCVIVEGYLDALAFWKYMPAVACLGTSLSEEHLRMIWSITPEPIVCFDGDQAGKKGAYRALCTALPLLEPGNTLRIATLPFGQDPQSILHYQGWEMMERILNDASPLFEALYQHVFSQEVSLTPERQAKAVILWKQQIETIRNIEVKRAYQAFFKERFYKKRTIFSKNQQVSCSVSVVLGVEILLGSVCIFPGLLGEVQELLVQLFCPDAYIPLKEALIEWKVHQENDFDTCHHVPTLVNFSDISWYEDLIRRIMPHLVFWKHLNLQDLQEQWIELFNTYQTEFYLKGVRSHLKDDVQFLFSQWEELKLLTLKDDAL
ncbi:DNA primase [Holospora obtusa F1]|uniref:DNA primase n=1 Tax=Holospora obtusa F1 TaxID=1399147 RepID=W6TD95_HOLOB|nr:DNA primase [Holospora obtusa]ETZ06696.1 DNA primase [Holospora obtusa F1]